MVDKKITQIIRSGLSEHISINNVQCYPRNNLLGYIFNVDCYFFEISYFFMDDFYRIKVERRYNNSQQIVIFLTKSKRFQKEIQMLLKKRKLSRKSFENHMECFMLVLNEIISHSGDLNALVENYVCDLKFDGIFI